MKPWKPRASQLGVYLACPWRAANDRAIHEGRVKRDEIGKWEEGPHAAHGTVIHYYTQVGIGGIFLPKEPTPEEVEDAKEHFGGDAAAALAAFRAGDHRAYAPRRSEWDQAAGMFNGNIGAHRDSVVRVSQRLASATPKASDGKPWIVESTWETDYCTGHIDLLSQDHEEIEDYKTTSKPPNIAKVSCKPSYIAQMVIYHRFTGAKRGVIRHIDARSGAWVYPLPIDFTLPGVQFYADQLESFCRFLMSDRLWDVAWPNIGEHCQDTWCPYRISCLHKIVPPPARIHDIDKAMKQSGVVLPPRINLATFRN